MTKSTGKIGTVLLGICIGGISYWRTPYAEMSLSDTSFWVIAGLGSFLGALVSGLLFRQKSLNAALLISSGVVLSLLFRIIYEVAFWDSASHNLAGVEIIIAGLQSLPLALIGAFSSRLFQKKSDALS